MSNPKHFITSGVYLLVWKYDHSGGRRVTTKQRLFTPVAPFTVLRFEGYYKSWKWDEDNFQIEVLAN